MKKLGISIFLALFVLLSFGVASAITLNFDGISNLNDVDGNGNGYGGFTWTNASIYNDALSISLINNSTTTITRDTTFSLGAADFLLTGLGEVWVTVVGSDGTYAEFEFTKDDNDATQDNDSLTANLSAFVDITTLSFYISKANANVTLTIDNLEYNLGGNDTVPEPATMILFGLGMLGIAGTARKKMSA